MYPEWKDLKATERLEETRDQVMKLLQLNTQYLECEFFHSDDPKQLNWQNVTQRDFFALSVLDKLVQNVAQIFGPALI